MDALKHLQQSVGGGYPAEDIFGQLSADEIIEEMESYASAKTDEARKDCEQQHSDLQKRLTKIQNASGRD